MCRGARGIKDLITENGLLFFFYLYTGRNRDTGKEYWPNDQFSAK